MTASLHVHEFWTNISNYEMRATCTHCGDTTESLEQIQAECTTEGNALVWGLVQHAWPERVDNWTKPSLGHILRCGNLDPDADDSPQRRGATRLKRISLSESVYLLWTLCCDRVIGNQTYSCVAMITKWKTAIANRLDIDRRLAKSNRRNYTKVKVLHTWISIIANPEFLPHDWVINLRV